MPQDNSTPNVSTLFFFVDGTAPGQLQGPLAEMLHRVLATRSHWVVSAPELVNEPDDYGLLLGVVLRIPKPDVSDLEREWLALAEVSNLVSELEQFSATYHLEFAAELDGTSVGWVEHGHRDRMLDEGLLLAWEETLLSRGGKDQSS